MAIEAARLTIKIDTNADQASRQIGNLNKSTQGLGTTLKSFATSAGLALGAAAFINIGRAAVDAASNAEETRSKFLTVFRDISGAAESASTVLQDQFFLSQQTAEELLGTTGDLLTGFGFTQDAALDLSLEVQKLASDLASFNNIQGGAEEASRRLTSGILGETEGLKSLGIVVRQDTEQFRERVKEIAANTGATEQAAKAQAIFEEAIKQSDNAIGDVDRTSGSFANQLRQLEQNAEDLAAKLGNVLLPVVNAAVTALNRILDPGDAGLLEERGRQFDNLRKALNDYGGAVDNIVDRGEDLNLTAEEQIEFNKAQAAAIADLNAELRAQAVNLLDQGVPLNEVIEGFKTLGLESDAAEEAVEQFIKTYGEATSAGVDLVNADSLNAIGEQNNERIRQEKLVQQAAIDEALATLNKTKQLNENFRDSDLIDQQEYLESQITALKEYAATYVEVTGNTLDESTSIALQQIALLEDQLAALSTEYGRNVESVKTLIADRAQAAANALLAEAKLIGENESLFLDAEEAKADAVDTTTDSLGRQLTTLEDLGLDAKSFFDSIIGSFDDLANALIKGEDAGVAFGASLLDIFASILDALSAQLFAQAAVESAFLLGPIGIPQAIAGGIAAGVAALAVRTGASALRSTARAQFGGSFVAPGNQADSGLLRVNQGERVDVTPVRQSGEMSGGGDMVVKLDRAGTSKYLQSIFDRGEVRLTKPGSVAARAVG